MGFSLNKLSKNLSATNYISKNRLNSFSQTLKFKINLCPNNDIQKKEHLNNEAIKLGVDLYVYGLLCYTAKINKIL